MTQQDEWGPQDVIRYDPLTGHLFWLSRPVEMFGGYDPERAMLLWNGRYAGKQAFVCLDGYGYFCGGLFGKSVKAHRVAWAVYYGRWPEGEIDHIDGDRSNNRISNLRLSTREGNTRNTNVGHGSSSFRGVQKKPNGKFAAKIRYNGKAHHIGTFKTEEEAAAAYILKAKEHHGEFAFRGMAILEDLPQDVDA